MNNLRTWRLKVRGYSHQFNEKEDYMRNVGLVEATQRKGKWEYLNKLERERREKDPSFKGFYSNLKNELGRMISMIANYDEILASKLKIRIGQQVEEQEEEGQEERPSYEPSKSKGKEILTGESS